MRCRILSRGKFYFSFVCAITGERLKKVVMYHFQSRRGTPFSLAGWGCGPQKCCSRRQFRYISKICCQYINKECSEPNIESKFGARRAILFSSVLFSLSATCGDALALSSQSFLSGTMPLFLSPEPVQIPRRTLNRNFAVMLLRTGYETLDFLDFVATDKFQQEFWLTRAAEWEPYRMQYSPIIIEQVGIV